MRASAANEPGALTTGGPNRCGTVACGRGKFCGGGVGPFSSRTPERAESRKFSGQAENFRELNGPFVA